jgi:hypothetical protein
VILSSDPEEDYALPRNVVIEVDSTPGRTRPRPFWSGQMAPDGLVDTGADGNLCPVDHDHRAGRVEAGPVGIAQVRFE